MNERLSFLQQKTSKLTLSPGVYLMKDESGHIIYIGKAKSLRKRVTSYFRNNPDHPPKVSRMVENVYDYDFIVTDSEYEALILECSLIKQHRPKYNILLKDDKGYHYIKISNEMYPKITAEKKLDNSGEFIGPYMSAFVSKQTVDEVNKVFKLPTCKNKFIGNSKKSRPCLNFHINQCIGVCNGNIDSAEYKEIINQAIEYIKNGSEKSVNRLQKEMEIAAESLDFERAARIRDRILAITRAAETQKILDDNLMDCDVLASARSPKGSCVSVLMYRNGKLYDKMIHPFTENECEDNLTESFIPMYYLSVPDVPKTIYVDTELENNDIVRKALIDKCGHNVKILYPQRGHMLKYVMMAKGNAEEYLSIKNDRTGKELAALDELSQILGMKKPPEYIEAYDISNISSSSMVAGMIVFKNGRPYKKAYKRFSIKDNLIQNDYGCMREVFERRFNEYLKGKDEGFSVLPDLIFVDGGKGQVNAVLPVLKKLNVEVPVYGLVKDNKHRTRAISAGGGEISVSQNRAAFVLITKIQDEVHRFSIAYMKSRHTKSSYSYELTKVKGIGEKKAQKLILKYKTKDSLKKASPEELSSAVGISAETAKELYKFIQNM